MKFSIKVANQPNLNSSCLISGVFDSRPLTAQTKFINHEARSFITRIIERGDLPAKTGTTLLLHDIPGSVYTRLLLVSLGKEKEFCKKTYMDVVRSIIKTLAGSGITDATFLLPGIVSQKIDAGWAIRQAVILTEDVLYRFDHFKSKKDEPPSLQHLTFVTSRNKGLAHAEESLIQGGAISKGIKLSKDLGNTPGNICTPTYMAKIAKKMADEFSLKCQILERKDMEKLGMNALLSVSKGSSEPPKLIVLHYLGAKGRAQKARGSIVLAGKGITFDSGGISLKPAENLNQMKFDMSGAASVLGTLKATILMGLPIDLTVLVPCAENMPDGQAGKPGDIVTSMSGQTIEIVNTDAEGRLILCDALTYAERFKPDTVIDVATLTGACVIALGHVASGLFTNDDTLLSDLVSAGEISYDRVWPMPLWKDYQKLLKSSFADMANTGGRPAGAISAACFLERFAKKYKWAHLDVAGTAWNSTGSICSTGRPVSLLTHYLLKRCGRLD